MTELDVEPVDSVDEAVDPDVEASLPAGVDAPEYVLYGGKGGVGKTTMAAATALSSAAGGARTLVVSTDPAHSLSDTLGVDVPTDPARVREEIPLFAAEIDPDAALEDGPLGEGAPDLGGLLGGLGGQGADAGGGGDLEGSPFDPLLGGTMPGADEAAAMRQLLAYLDDPRFDRVVVDTAPTGHTLRLLELPDVLDTMVGRILRLRDQFGGMVEGLKGMFGAGDGAGDGEAGPDLDELRERIERLRAVLSDPGRTDFRLVMVPEEMSVVESERLVRRLDEFDIPVQTLVVNRVMEPLADVVDDGMVAPAADSTGERDEGGSGGDDAGPDAGDSAHAHDDPAGLVVPPDPESCAFCARRWEVQQRALDRATDLFRGRDVRRVPLLADEVRGERALRVVAACLA